jgi:hypothetical protein
MRVFLLKIQSCLLDLKLQRNFDVAWRQAVLAYRPSQ